MSTLRRWFGLARVVADEAREQEITFLAASIAYYAFVSLLPMLLLGLAVASFLGGDRLAVQVATAAGDVLTPSGQGLVMEVLLNEAGRGGATILGSLVLLWGTLRMFRGLDAAFSRVYGVAVAESIVEELLDATVVVVVIALGLAAMVLAGFALTLFPDVPFAGTLSTIALSVALLPVFLPLYYFFPDVDVSLREALPGAVVATVGWTLLQVGFRFYVQNAGRFDAYGVLGGAILLVTWLYVGAILLLVGAVVNVVLAGRVDATDAEGGGAGETTYLQGRRGRPRERRTASMTDSTSSDEEADASDREVRPAPDLAEIQAEIEALGDDLQTFADDVEERTVERETVESELKAYVRSRIRRGHARGWGPYLVLLYGTAMTLGAFYWLRGGWSILAMLVIWTSTLGVYVLMVVFGFGLGALGVPGRIADRLRSWRS